MKLLIHIDGGSRGNPGPAAAGVVIRQEDPPKVLHEAGYFLGRATNNIAEYTALVRALELAVARSADEVAIASDSELMVRQLTGEYRVKSPDLLPLYEKAQALLLNIDAWTLRHVRREQNKRADELVNLALDRKRDVIVTAEAGAAGLSNAAGSEAASSSETAASGTAAAPAAAKAAAAPLAAWDASFERPPGEECPARCPAGKRFRFGPTTPAGFCLFAAQAVLDELPLRDRAEASATQTRCEHCDASIRLDPAE